MKTVGFCRYCGNNLSQPFLDLGLQPLSNDYLSDNRIKKGQHFLPLRMCRCSSCGLIQLSEYEAPNSIFNEEYRYFSSYSTSWVEHSKQYVDMICDRLSLSDNSMVYEVASNDGYLLQFFLNKGINPIGIEPSSATAQVAIEKGINTIIDFFGKQLAEQLSNNGQKADLIIGNNVLAHVPNIKDFVAGLRILLKDNGTVTMEFPHFLNILKNKQFDTVYHEHFSYMTFDSTQRIFLDCGLKIYDVEKLNTHGGSLRIYATAIENDSISESDAISAIIDEELEYGINKEDTYRDYESSIIKLKNHILKKVISIKENGKSIIGYGAAAKGNTLFNYCGIGNEYIDYVVDANPYKQNMYLPGSLIPIHSPEIIRLTKPDYIIIIPWNIKDEIKKQLSFVSEWNGHFLTFIPEVEEFS